MELTWAEFKKFVDTRLLSVQYAEVGSNYWLKAFDGTFNVECLVPLDETNVDTAVFIASYKANGNKKLFTEVSSIPSFGAKSFYSGTTLKKLYARFTGQQFALSIGANTCDFTMAYPWVKMVGLELIGGELGDTASLKVIDTALGTYSGVPNYTLNQFGYVVNVAKDFYARASQFDSDLYPGMIIRLEYTSISAKTIGVNYLINEAKS
jgi:hypothetical protein